MPSLSKNYNLTLKSPLYIILCFVYFSTFLLMSGAKGDWDFRISDLVKNPDGTDI